MSFWNDEQVTKAEHLWRDGRSAAQIAALIGAPSRNAVIGKLTRLGLTGFGRGHRPAVATVSVAAPPVKPGPRVRHGNVARKAASRQFDAGPLEVTLKPVREPRRNGWKLPTVAFSNKVRAVQRQAEREAAQPEWRESLDKQLEAKERAFAPIGGGKTLEALRAHDCRWPHGIIGDESFRYCAEATDGSGPYCRAHAALAYRPASPRARGLATGQSLLEGKVQ